MCHNSHSPRPKKIKSNQHTLIKLPKIEDYLRKIDNILPRIKSKKDHIQGENTLIREMKTPVLLVKANTIVHWKKQTKKEKRKRKAFFHCYRNCNEITYILEGICGNSQG